MKKKPVEIDPNDIFKLKRLKVTDEDTKKHWDKIFSKIAISKPISKTGNQ